MKFEKQIKIDVDLQSVFESLDTEDRKSFLEVNISSASNDVLIQELIGRGFEIVKG